jgi:uncharacterized protein YciI
MLFVFHALDKPDHLHLRRAHTDEHVAYVKGASSVTLVLAGPFIGADGESVIGSLIVVDAADADTARAFFENDPYNKAGLFEATRITAWRKTIGWNDPD